MFLSLSGIDLVFLVIAMLVSLTIHEAMHGYMAHWLGDLTAYHSGRLTLNPFKHIDVATTLVLPLVLVMLGMQPFFAAKPVPFNPNKVKFGDYGAALVGLAGPITNLILAMLGGIIIRLFFQNINQEVLNFLLIFIEVNIGFFIFNMIPFPPLDGSRLVYAFAPQFLQNIMQRIEGYGFLAIVVFMIFVFQFISGPIINIETSLFRLILRI